MKMSDKAASSTSKWSDLAVRAVSAVVMAAVAISAIIEGDWFYRLMLVFVGAIIFYEWCMMTKSSSNRLVWSAAGLLYALIPIVSLDYLRKLGLSECVMKYDGLFVVLLIVLMVIATDVGAYFSGRLFGGPKLAPRISPKKTWAGLLGGAAAAAIVPVFLPFVYYRFFPERLQGDLVAPVTFQISWDSIRAALVLGCVVAVVAQTGDIAESAMKRHFGVKDSSQLIPGHGGVMDRVDGLVPVAVLFAIFIWLMNK
jgi:phosphatidate cytidylyltransferase